MHTVKNVKEHEARLNIKHKTAQILRGGFGIRIFFYKKE